MKLQYKLLIGVLTTLVLLCVLAITFTLSTLNSETSLRNKLIQQNESVKTSYSAGFSEVTTKYKFNKEQNEFLKGVYLGVVEGRYKSDNQVMFKMITEQNPAIDTSIAKDFSNSVSTYFSSRAELFKSLSDTKRRHDTMLDSYPGAILYKFAGRGKIDIVYIVDSGTKEAFKTGIDDRDIVK
jgi:hypothetical protein